MLRNADYWAPELLYNEVGDPVIFLSLIMAGVYVTLVFNAGARKKKKVTNAEAIQTTSRNELYFLSTQDTL